MPDLQQCQKWEPISHHALAHGAERILHLQRQLRHGPLQRCRARVRAEALFKGGLARKTRRLHVVTREPLGAAHAAWQLDVDVER